MKSEIQYFLNKSPYGNKQLQYHKPHTPEKPDQYYTKKEIDYLLKNIDISNKVDKEEGKGLSTNDYTTDDKNKLNTLPTNKVLTTILNGKVDTDDLDKYILKTDSDDHGNMSIYSPGNLVMTLTDEQGSVNQIGTFYAGGWSVSSPDGKFQTFGNSIYRGTMGFDHDSVVWEKTATQQIPAATSETNGLMSASDKSKLNSLPTATQLSQELGDKANSADLAEVATSGSYNDLSDKPTIPAAQVQSDWNESDTTSKAYIKNKPTIPTVPTNVSAFNNDAGYITASYVAAKQDKMSIVQVASGTTAINAAINTYYEVTGEVGTMAITLPEPTDTIKVAMVVIHLLAGTTPNVVIGSTVVIDYSSAYDISAGNEYEINCLFNGDKWIVADMEVV